MFKELIKEIEKGNTEVFYKDSRWLKKRKDILSRDRFECQLCKREGRVGKGECVHHIKHLKDRPDLALVDSNLVSLCYTCHNRVHPEKLHSNDRARGYTNKERW